MDRRRSHGNPSILAVDDWGRVRGVCDESGSGESNGRESPQRRTPQESRQRGPVGKRWGPYGSTSREDGTVEGQGRRTHVGKTSCLDQCRKEVEEGPEVQSGTRGSGRRRHLRTPDTETSEVTGPVCDEVHSVGRVGSRKRVQHGGGGIGTGVDWKRPS